MHIAVASGEDYNFEEYCSDCDTTIPVRIDNNEHSCYEIICPSCGKKVMLCTLCKWDYLDTFGGYDYPCDWSEESGCYRQKKGQRK